ncbi:Yip1 family protein [Rhodococcoides fascians]|uniref:Yip1 family protein n=1 Tax=Rhodococcoides fascians TaxID=1828 RepID=UPI00050C1B6F|nr:Yip1 family protein [Rhodococcus fascians]
MSENNPEDTGQISVAELLARNGQQTNLSTGGRRRRGVKGGISVAELTGEIPVVRDEPGSRSAPVVDAPAPPPADRDTPAPARVEADDDRVTPDDAPAFLSSRPQPARPQSARPTAFQPVARREKQQPEPELLSGSTTVAGDLLNRSHDDTERGHRPAAPTTPPERQPYGSTAAEQGRNRKPAGFTAPRQVEVAEPNTDVTPRAAVIDVDDVAKTAVSARIARTDDTESTATGKVASTEAPATSVPTQAVDLVEPDAERDAEDNTAAAPETETDASPATRSGRRASAAKGKGGAVRQWLVLLGQAVVAIVVGALLFKGFEQLWDVLPWVALVLSVLVIVGLVAVVRILRRTDDLISIVIAIAVGVFVTLGPLAFQLSTG